MYDIAFVGCIAGCPQLTVVKLLSKLDPKAELQFCNLDQLLCFFYIHVTVHRNKFLFNKTNKTHEFPKFYFVKKLYMFWVFPLPNFRSCLLYIHSTLLHFLQAGSESRPCLEAVIRVCRFFDKIKFEKFVRLVGFIKTKSVALYLVHT